MAVIYDYRYRELEAQIAELKNEILKTQKLKTAKEICDGIKSKRTAEFNQQVNGLIEEIERYEGQTTIYSHKADGSYYDTKDDKLVENYLYQSLITSGILEALQELGYKVTYIDATISLARYGERFETRTFFGIPFGKRQIRHSKRTYVQVPCKAIVISACCGEEK